LNKIRFKKNPHLDHLDRIFNFDLASFLPPVFSIFVDQISKSSVVLAIIVSPYILYLLFRLKKYGWLLFFLIFVGVPSVGSHQLLGGTDWSMLVYFIFLIFLAVYLFILNMSYKDWREPIFY
jgi:Ca2+/Na+ antiporter